MRQPIRRTTPDFEGGMVGARTSYIGNLMVIEAPIQATAPLFVHHKNDFCGTKFARSSTNHSAVVAPISLTCFTLATPSPHRGAFNVWSLRTEKGLRKPRIEKECALPAERFPHDMRLCASTKGGSREFLCILAAGHDSWLLRLPLGFPRGHSFDKFHELLQFSTRVDRLAQLQTGGAPGFDLIERDRV